MPELDPRRADLQDMLRSEVYNHLEKVAKIWATSGKLLIEYKTWPEAQLGAACLKRIYSYDDPVDPDLVTGEIVSIDIWTQTLEDLACPPLLGTQLTSTVVQDAAPAGTKVADICSVGGKPEFTYVITADPSSKFTITNNGELKLSAVADIADISYSVTIEITDDNGDVASTIHTITVVAEAQAPVPLPTNGSVEVLQAVHDYLNLNANLQVGDSDVSATNPVPVTGTVNTDSSVEGPFKVTGETVTATSAAFPTAANQASRVALSIRNTDTKESIWVVNSAGISLATAGVDSWEIGPNETFNTDYSDTNKIFLVADAGKSVQITLLEVAD